MTGDKQQGIRSFGHSSVIKIHLTSCSRNRLHRDRHINSVWASYLDPQPNQFSAFVPLWHICVQQYHLKHQKLSAIRPSTLPFLHPSTLPTSRRHVVSPCFAPTPDSCAYFQTSRHLHYSIPEPSRRACEPGEPPLGWFSRDHTGRRVVDLGTSC